jgi:hypothetical protein
MRLSALAAVALLSSAAARADDTKPPQISDVRATLKGSQVQVEARITDETGVLSAVCHHRSPGGKVEDSPMVKNDFDDVFRASFAGGAGTEYWIDASDLLGNGPSAYGSSAKAFAVNGKSEGGKVASAEPPAKKRQPKPERPARTARASEPPAIQHSVAATPPPEGRDLTVRARIRSDSPVAVAVLQARPQGTSAFTNLALSRTGGDSWEGQIPATMARGRVEYFIAAKNQAGQMTRQGAGDAQTPYVVAFRSGGAPVAAATAADPPAGPYVFTDDPPVRVVPGQPILVRVQVVPPSERGEIPDRVAVLWRGNDAQDQLTDMVKDETGGWGGYKAVLPPQEEGAIFYQVVACDASASRCGVDTGSKRRWHATAVGSQPVKARPLPLDVVSTKAPPSLPE